VKAHGFHHGSSSLWRQIARYNSPGFNLGQFAHAQVRCAPTHAPVARRPPIPNEPLLTPEQLSARLGEFYKALEEFNDGYYFESHETLEDLWMVTPLPERQFFQAVIQLAAAFVHLVRGEYPGIIKLLDASLDKLQDFAPTCLGVDVASLTHDVKRCRAEIAALGPDAFTSWNEGARPSIVFQRPI
jgi:hypothetical protein